MQFLYSLPSLQIHLTTKTQPTPRVKQVGKAAESQGVQRESWKDKSWGRTERQGSLVSKSLTLGPGPWCPVVGQRANVQGPPSPPSTSIPFRTLSLESSSGLCLPQLPSVEFDITMTTSGPLLAVWPWAESRASQNLNLGVLVCV